MTPALELGVMPEGGGYPRGLPEAAAKLMGCPNLAEVVHLCSGSVSGGRATVDIRRELAPTVVADVRWLPFRPGSLRWILVDPPYGQDYAEELWGLGRVYPTPAVLMRECAQVLAPGGKVGFFHQVVPRLPEGLRNVGIFGISTGPGYRMRALTIAERALEAAHLF